VENIPGHRDHHSGVPNQLITISPEWVITIVWNPDHDHPGIGDHDRPESLITIVRNPQLFGEGRFQVIVIPLRYHPGKVIFHG
jgi:hypothetical protein